MVSHASMRTWRTFDRFSLGWYLFRPWAIAASTSLCKFAVQNLTCLPVKRHQMATPGIRSYHVPLDANGDEEIRRDVPGNSAIQITSPARRAGCDSDLSAPPTNPIQRVGRSHQAGRQTDGLASVGSSHLTLRCR